MEDKADVNRAPSFELQLATRSLPSDFVRLNQDLFSPLAGKKQLYTYETMDFWEQTPGMAIECSALYLAQFRSVPLHICWQMEMVKRMLRLLEMSIFIHQQKYIQLQRLDPMSKYQQMFE